MTSEKLRTLKRHIRYCGQYLLEKMQGLDFTMPDMSASNATEGKVHGYCKTEEESHIKKLFQSIGVHEEDCLLDIGCGKGAVLREATCFPFKTIAGIEYSEHLANTAKNNFRKLNLSERVQIFQGDATEFEYYASYNVFYLANPFGEEVMDKVIGKIVDVHRRKSWIIYHHPVFKHIFDKWGRKSAIGYLMKRQVMKLQYIFWIERNM